MTYVKLKNAFLICGLMSLMFFGCSSSSSVHRYSKEEIKVVKNEGSAKKDTAVSPVIVFQSQEAEEETEEDTSPEPSNRGLSALDNISNPGKISKTNPAIGANFADIIETMKMAIVKYDETPYHYGGSSLKGIDCSGFTSNVYLQTFKVQLPRSAHDQYGAGEVVSSQEDLKFGDLVFFDTGRRAKPGHVGIYLGDGNFVHSHSRLGVVVSNLSEQYYVRTYMGGRRIFDIESASKWEK